MSRSWEGRLLAIDGPDGRRRVEVEHAIEGVRTLRVVVQGTLDEARCAGLLRRASMIFRQHCARTSQAS
ncbi:hypothetical protein ACPEIC_47640 [Stenotrophomonas sp. NPDC087984]